MKTRNIEKQSKRSISLIKVPLPSLRRVAIPAYSTISTRMRQSLMKLLYLSILLILITPLLRADVVTVDATSGPWDPLRNMGFDYGRGDQTPPASVPVAEGEWLFVGNASGQVYADQAGLGPFGPDGYTNNWWGADNGRDYTPGIHFPSKYVSTNDYPVYFMALLGTFADNSGTIVGTPFKVGSQSLTLNVPPGAARLLFGFEDDRYGDNSGNLTVDVELIHPVNITQQPASQSCCRGQTVSFYVGATGSPPLAYEWIFNGQAMAGETNTTLTLTELQSTNAGLYQVVVSNPYGSVPSALAQLTVADACVDLHMFAGLNISGQVGSTYVLSYTTDLSKTNSWVPLATNTMTSAGWFFLDMDSPFAPKRFYKTVLQP